MVQYFDRIPDFLVTWINKQHIFWVATAPLTADGLVNLSPKGVTGSFRVLNSNQVWYEDLTGSGIETVAHVRENGRITILFNAFEGPPRICRLYGKGTVYEFGTPEYEALLPPEKREIGSRSIIMIDVFKVGTSCGFAVPFYTYKAERTRLLSYNLPQELVDIEAENALSDMSSCSVAPRPVKGLKRYWLSDNAKSQDGLPGILTGHASLTRFQPPKSGLKKDDEREGTFGVGELKLVAAFLTGVILTASYGKFIKVAS